MGKPYYEDVARLLNIEINKPYYITGLTSMHRMTKYGIDYYSEDTKKWIKASNNLLDDLLLGEREFVNKAWPKLGDTYYVITFGLSDSSIVERAWTNTDRDYFAKMLGLISYNREYLEVNYDRLVAEARQKLDKDYTAIVIKEDKQ